MERKLRALVVKMIIMPARTSAPTPAATINSANVKPREQRETSDEWWGANMEPNTESLVTRRLLFFLDLRFINQAQFSHSVSGDVLLDAVLGHVRLHGTAALHVARGPRCLDCNQQHV